ncbi:MAG: NAD-dependent epimerase/dehydratase family protein [Alphaproteobacteria bacterium]
MALEFYRGRTCLVTGCGFVGSHLVDALLEAGAEVRVTVHRRGPHREHPRLRPVEADLTLVPDCVRVASGVDCVFHAAGTVGASGVGPSAAMAGIALNLTLAANVLLGAWQAGVGRVLVFSSSTGYPVLTYPVREDTFWDGEVFPGYFGYGWMRRYTERLAEYVARNSAVKVSIVRPGALYGPRDNFDPATCHVIAALINRALAGEDPFLVWGTGEDVRDILHIRDFVRGCLLALEHKADCDPINLGCGFGTSTRQLATQVLAAAGRADTEIHFDPTRPTAIPYRVLDITKARAELGFSPDISLGEGVAETMDWLRAGRNGR